MGHELQRPAITSATRQRLGQRGLKLVHDAGPEQEISQLWRLRVQHLGHFLDVENYPTITFRSTSAEEVDSDTYKLVGDLTIKDKSHPVTLELDFQGSSPDPFGNTRAGFEGKTTVNRKDWGLTWNVAIEGGGILVGEKVKLELDVSAIKRSDTPQE